MATVTAESIQITLQRLGGAGDQIRVRVLDQGVDAASGRSVCMTAEEAARMVGQIYSAGRERGAHISLEVAPDDPGYGPPWLFAAPGAQHDPAPGLSFPRPSAPSRIPVSLRLTRQPRRTRLF